MNANHFDLQPENFIVKGDHETQLLDLVMIDIGAMWLLLDEEAGYAGWHCILLPKQQRLLTHRQARSFVFSPDHLSGGRSWMLYTPMMIVNRQLWYFRLPSRLEELLRASITKIEWLLCGIFSISASNTAAKSCLSLHVNDSIHAFRNRVAAKLSTARESDASQFGRHAALSTISAYFFG